MTTLNIIAFTCLVIVVSCQSQGRPGGPPGPPGGGPPGMPFPLMPQGGGVGSGGQQGSKSGSEGGGLNLPLMWMLADGGGNMGRAALFSGLLGGRSQNLFGGGGGGSGFLRSPFGLMAASGRMGDNMQNLASCQIAGITDPLMCSVMLGGL